MNSICRKYKKKNNFSYLGLILLVAVALVSCMMETVTVVGPNLEVEESNEVNIEMIEVDGGTFQMGSNDGESDEKPIHSVTLISYFIGKYPVTQAQWKAVMGASTTLSNPSNNKNCDNCPVENVSWDDVSGFIVGLNRQTGKKYRLPTEAEWEYAARGGNRSQGYTYSGSNTIDNVAWCKDNSSSKTHPVGEKQANELGIYDMSGNVWEWCSDWYDAYSSGSQTNPTGPNSGSNRVLRGGSWINNATNCRVVYRNFAAPSHRSFLIGFRLALSKD